MMSSTRLQLKPFTCNDAEECYGCITPTLTKYMSWDPPQDRIAFENIWRTWLITIKDESDWVFVIRNQLNDEFLDLVGFHQAKQSRPELGIWIREDRHGFGYGKEAVTAIAHWASQHFNFEAFIYPVAIENDASRRIAESLNGTPVYCSQQPKYKSMTYLIPKT
ncbi:GNAT family N-acetyltransferase [Acinetobacter nematophilus]|uniref:GNAT family N-acetyltransferase n=1 Tax=Acinetobacter nematophilus TaxID=2994642 RepID=UPI003AF82FB4